MSDNLYCFDRSSRVAKTCIAAVLVAFSSNAIAVAQAPPFVDGKFDGVWTSRRGQQVFAYIAGDKAATLEIVGPPVQIAPNSIYEKPDQH